MNNDSFPCTRCNKVGKVVSSDGDLFSCENCIPHQITNFDHVDIEKLFYGEIKFYRDGDMFIVLLGKDLAEGISGTGKDLRTAILDFQTNLKDAEKQSK